MKYIKLKSERPEAEVNRMERQMIGIDDVKVLVEKTDTTVVTPAGDIHAVFLKNAIPKQTCQVAYPFLLKGATSNVIGGFRGTAAGTGTQRAYKKDGALSKMRRVPDTPRLHGAKSGQLGYLDENNFTPCRLTAYTRDHWEHFGSTVLPYIQTVDSLFQSHMAGALRGPIKRGSYDAGLHD